MESRKLLTAVINGMFQGTGTFYDGSSRFEYKQQDDTIVRISVFGNVTAEFIGGRVPDASFNVIIRDLVPATDLEGDGVDLFSIYVLEADINSVISIAVVPPLATPTGRFMRPFDGSAGNVSIFNAQTGVIEQVDTGPGGVWIGARTHDFMNPDLNDQPIITPPDNRRRFGLRPASAGQMFSGLECAPGVNLGKFMLGGTITGLVDVPGNMRLFYAGGILTGDARGLPDGATSSISNNFFIGGDIEHLITGSSFGTTPGLEQEEIEDILYKTGFDLQVNGRIGWMRALDSFLGGMVVRNLANVRGLGIAQEELEFSGAPLNPLSDEAYFDPLFFGDAASLGTKTRNAAYNNNTFQTAQYLGTLFSTELNSREAIIVRGHTFSQFGDNADYYAVSLVAGQTVQVQLLNSFSGIGIFDPDGRLIATDSSNVSFSGRWNRPFRFTADRPGAYRIAIAARGDVNFNGVVDPGETHSVANPDFYELRIHRVADIALGGLIADQHIYTNDVGSDGITIERGDLGAVRAGVDTLGTVYSVSNPWRIDRGNLRSIEAFSIGVLRNTPVLTLVGRGPDLLVPRGTIGLLRTTGADPGNAMMWLNRNLVFNDDDLTQISPALATGVDIQLVDAAVNLQANLLSNRSIGVIRSGNVSALTASDPGVWAANVDGIGEDGRIDLIDIQGNLGELGPGGPAIATGPGGNVRYMRVGGTVFRDRFFGGGSGQVTNFQPGETVRLTDDNGTAYTMTPIPRVPLVDPVTGIPQPGFDRPGFLSVLTYPIRDKAGSVLLRVTVNPVDLTAGRGIEIISGARGRGGSVEVGEIVVRSAGTNFTFDPFTRAITPDPEGQNSDVLLNGPSPIDVWHIEARDPATDAFTGLTQIGNGTSGEIVNVRAAHVGGISANTIGLARQSTAAAVNGVDVQLSGYPFNQQRNLIAIAAPAGPGHLGSLRSRQGLGNIFVAGTIGTITANADNRNVRGVFEGINGVILAAHVGAATSAASGNIITANIGHGIASSGSGNVAFAGLFADGQIDRVRSSGVGADIRGDIVSRGDTPPVQTRINPTTGAIESTPGWFIGDIILNGGSIVDADIMTVTSFEDSREIDNLIVIPQRANVITAPVFQINSIRLGGIGGMIGSYVVADDIGPIIIDGGFGVISSLISSLGDSVIDGIITDGYGIRSTRIDGGANLNRLIARGTGKRIDTRFYSGSVRFSERMSFDPFSGNFLDGSNDLHKFLGTTAASPKRIGLSDAGVIEDTIAAASRDLGTVEAHRIIGRNVFFTDPNTGRRSRISFGATAYPMRFSFGNSIGSIRVRDFMDGLSLTSGGLNTFTVAGQVMNTALNVTGRIGDISAGALLGTTSVQARGPEGTIASIATRRSLYALVEATLDIGTIRIGTDLGSPNVSTSRNLNTLNVNGSILSGANVRVARTLGNLIVGQDIQAGATVRANAIGNQQVGGQILGDIIIE